MLHEAASFPVIPRVLDAPVATPQPASDAWFMHCIQSQEQIRHDITSIIGNLFWLHMNGHLVI